MNSNEVVDCTMDHLVHLLMSGNKTFTRLIIQMFDKRTLRSMISNNETYILGLITRFTARHGTSSSRAQVEALAEYIRTNLQYHKFDRYMLTKTLHLRRVMIQELDDEKY